MTKVSHSERSTSDFFPEIPDLDVALAGLLAQIPAGRVSTYGDVAEALGDRVAARWVGHFALHHPHDDRCACHRLVRADGQLGAYIEGLSAKARRFRAEGIPVRDERVDLARFRFDAFQSDRPLATLALAQERLARQAVLRPRRRMPRLVGGVDVSYTGAGEAVAAYVLLEADSREVLWSTALRRPTRFPYLSGYLAFRELPVLLELVEAVRAAGQTCDVLLVDGSGVLHPRRGGVATHLGVLAGVPTIGLTKKLLCGRADLEGMAAGESRPVFLDERLRGAAIRPTPGSRRPIFVSPGHQMNVGYAEAVVRQMLAGRRLPDPLYWADRLSRQTARAGAAPD